MCRSLLLSPWPPSREAAKERLTRMRPRSRAPGAIRASRRMSVRHSRSRTKRPSRMWSPTWSAHRSLKKLVYLDGRKAVLYRSRMNPFLGRNFEAMDPAGVAGPSGRPHPRRGPTSHPLLWLLRKPRQGLSAEEGSAGRPGRAGPRPETLFRRVGRGSSAGSSTPIRSFVRGAEARSRSWPTSPTRSRSSASSTTWA